MSSPRETVLHIIRDLRARIKRSPGLAADLPLSDEGLAVIESALSEIDTRLSDALDDVKRLHEEKMKFFERTIELERELATAKRQACTSEHRATCSFAASAIEPPHWTCGCGHVNGCNLEWCAMCYSRPNGRHKDE